MKATLVFSSTDPASANMRRAFARFEAELGSVGPFSLTLVELAKELVYVEGGELPDADFYVFLSRHVGGKSCFTLHSTGNPGYEAKLGGNPRSLGIAAPLLSYAFLRTLMDAPPMPVVYEATHHGPTELDRPCIFVEIGVTEADWSNPAYAEYVADSVIKAFREYDTASKNSGVACCFGGPHYASRFTEYAHAYGYSVGHIISKHALTPGDKTLIRLAVSRSTPKPSYAIIDWDGLRGDQRRTVLEEVGELGLATVRI